MYPPTFRDLSSEFEQREKKVLIWKSIHSFVRCRTTYKEGSFKFCQIIGDIFLSQSSSRKSVSFYRFFLQVTRQNFGDLRTK